MFNSKAPPAVASENAEPRRHRRWTAIAADIREHQLVGMTVPPPKPADPARHAQTPIVAWIDIIMTAAWEPRTLHINGELITLKRGEFVAARNYWAARWNWGVQAVRGFFSRLARAGMLAFSNQGSNQGVTVGKVSKFEAFQSRGGDQQPRAQQPSNQAATNISTKDTKETTKREASASPRDRGTRLSADWTLPPAWRDSAEQIGVARNRIELEAEKFADHFRSQAGAKGVKSDWEATWRNWCRRSSEFGPKQRQAPALVIDNTGKAALDPYGFLNGGRAHG